MEHDNENKLWPIGKALTPEQSEGEFSDCQMKQYLEASLDSLDAGFVLFDAQQNLVFTNTIFSTLYPVSMASSAELVSLQDLLKLNYLNYIYSTERRKGRAPDSEIYERWLNLRTQQVLKGRRYLERMRDGRWIEVTNVLNPEGSIISLHKDVTAERANKRQLEFLAWHDPLTGLINRNLFEAKLKAVFSTYPHNDRQIALMYIDLDDFKQINDRLGHHFGDALLKLVAQKLRSIVRIEDTVARLGGDEFAILLSTIDSDDALIEVGDRIIKELSKPEKFEDRHLSTGVSIGIVVCPRDASDMVSCMRYADLAMYQAKNSGKNQARLFQKKFLRVVSS